MTGDQTCKRVSWHSSSPGVGKEAIHDTGPFVLCGKNHCLLHAVVLLLSVSGTAHDPRLHEGGPRVGQQVLDPALVHLWNVRGFTK